MHHQLYKDVSVCSLVPMAIGGVTQQLAMTTWVSVCPVSATTMPTPVTVTRASVTIVNITQQVSVTECLYHHCQHNKSVSHGVHVIIVNTTGQCHRVSVSLSTQQVSVTQCPCHHCQHNRPVSQSVHVIIVNRSVSWSVQVIIVNTAGQCHSFRVIIVNTADQCYGVSVSSL